MGAGGRSADAVGSATTDFWKRIDTISRREPFKAVPYSPSDAHEKAFNPYTVATLWPPLLAIFRIAFALLRPLSPLAALSAGALGAISMQTAAITAAALFALLALFDYQFRLAFLGLHSFNHGPGVHAASTPFNNAVKERVTALQYPHYRPTPWLFGGDILTLYPYFAFLHADVQYVRRWLPVPEADGANAAFVCGRLRSSSNSAAAATANGSTGKSTSLKESDSSEGPDALAPLTETIALDFAVPEQGHSSSNPVYIVLHGLNGGSKEPYILDFVQAALARGSTTCVMVARGLMGTPVNGESLFHGARTADVEATCTQLRQALGPDTPLALVGFSMGGIVALNYVARAGQQCPVSSCVSIAGCFDTRTNMTFWHSRRVWQPLLGLCLKENFVAPHTAKLRARGLDPHSLAGLHDVVDFDTHMVAKYHRYEHVMDYYEDMSAGCLGKERNISVPTLAIHALDDPLMSADLPVHACSYNEHIMFLLTKTGGHVGWAQGWFPTQKKWEFSSTATIQYCEAVLDLQSKKKSD